MRTQLGFYLKGFAGLSAVVSDRVYQQRSPTGAVLPYVVFSFQGRDPNYDQQGIDGNDIILQSLSIS